MRRELVSHCAREIYPGGQLAVAGRNGDDFFGVTRGEADWAAVAAAEWADASGQFYQDEGLKESAFVAMEGCAASFTEEGLVGTMADGNAPYFALVPMTFALVKLKQGGADGARVGRITQACEKLFDTALIKRPAVMEYFNARALEAASALGLWQLTGRADYLALCKHRMEVLLASLYPCGAQPYHIGGWIWGRRPAQVYQIFSAAKMLYVGRALGMPEVEGFVRRILDYELLSMTWRGDTFTTPFEGLYKVAQGICLPWQWPLALAAGDAKYLPMAGVTYDRWLGVLHKTYSRAFLGRYPDPALGLMCMHLLNVKEMPSVTGVFRPAQGVHALKDISTVFVHEEKVDVAMTVLTGYSAWVEAECGDVRVLALGPEVMESPTYRNFGTDAVRLDWKVASEQDLCEAGEGKALLKGRGFTKWDSESPKCSDVSLLHTRELEATMTYAGRELVVSYRTLKDRGAQKVVSRILLLIGVFPKEAAGKLRIGGEEWETPAAAAVGEYRIEAPLGVVEFSAPDGSRVAIEARIPGASRVVVERPAVQMREGQVVKPANDGFLRLSFEGSDVLERGAITLSFYPCGS
jgi:hypothetical protein